jgi:hypothetical protein
LIRVIRVTAASRGMLARRMSTDLIPASRGIASLTDIPEGECRHGPPELVVGCKLRVIPMPSPAIASPLRTRVQSLLCPIDQSFSIPRRVTMSNDKHVSQKVGFKK